MRVPHATLRDGAARLRSFVEAAEETSIDRLWVGDHVSFKGGQGYDGLLHSMAVAVLTERVTVADRRVLAAAPPPARRRPPGVVDRRSGTRPVRVRRRRRWRRSRRGAQLRRRPRDPGAPHRRVAAPRAPPARWGRGHARRRVLRAQRASIRPCPTPQFRWSSAVVRRRAAPGRTRRGRLARRLRHARPVRRRPRRGRRRRPPPVGRGVDQHGVLAWCGFGRSPAAEMEACTASPTSDSSATPRTARRTTSPPRWRPTSLPAPVPSSSRGR